MRSTDNIVISGGLLWKICISNNHDIPPVESGKDMSKKCKRINIYLTDKDRKRLNEIKNKYYLSYSTIANIVVSVYYLIPEIRNQEDYIYKDRGIKTSIKPRDSKYENAPKLFTNALLIYLRGDLKKYTNEKMVQKANNMIANQFTKTHDENWNGNQLSRFIPKFIKQNPKYIRKILNEDE